jgi:hypothetical protein
MKTGIRFRHSSLILALAAFCSGYLTYWATVPAGEGSMVHAPAPEKTESPRSISDVSQSEDNLRKGRVLSALLESSRQFDETTRRYDFELAASEIGPLEIEAALGLAYRLPYDPRHELIPILVARWAQFDPKASAEYSLHPRPVHFNGQSDLLFEAMAAWAKIDFAAGKAWAVSLPDPVKRGQALGGLIEGIARMDPARAIEMVEDIQPNFPALATYRIMAAVAAKDPAMVARYIERDPLRCRYLGLVDLVLREWPSKDFDAAMAWASNLATSEARASARTKLFASRIEDDPRWVSDSLLRLPPGQERQKMFGEVSRQIAGKPRQLMGFAMNLPSGAERTSLIDAALRSWTHQDPLEAMATVQSWTSDVCTPAEKDSHEKQILWLWVRSDRDAVVAWIENGPAEKRDACFETAALGTVNSKVGLDVGGKIQDPTLRESTMRKLYEQWAKGDAQGAADWLQGAAIPQEWKAAWSRPDLSRAK